MKTTYYFIKYSVIMLLGYVIQFIGLTSIYNLSYIIIIPFNWLAIYFGIKRPLEDKKDISYKEIILALIILCSILNTIILSLVGINLNTWIILNISTIIGLIILKPRENKMIEKNIREYFDNKKREDTNNK